MKNQEGLTLVELLIVIAIIAILAAVAFVAIDPAARFAEARNAQRWTDVSTVMEGVQQAFVDEEGDLSSSTYLSDLDTDSASVQIITDGAASLTCGSYTCGTETVAGSSCEVDLSTMEGEYFAAVPIDPSSSSTTDSMYYLNYDSGIFTVGACDPEEEKDGSTPTVQVSR